MHHTDRAGLMKLSAIEEEKGTGTNPLCLDEPQYIGERKSHQDIQRRLVILRSYKCLVLSWN